MSPDPALRDPSTLTEPPGIAGDSPADDSLPRLIGLPSAAALDASAVPLASLRTGQLARLHLMNLPRPDSQFLSALGLTVGSAFRVCHAGDPWILQVRATRIGLAESVARRLMVVVQPEA